VFAVQSRWVVNSASGGPGNIGQTDSMPIPTPGDAVSHERDVAAREALPRLLTRQAPEPAAARLPHQVPGLGVSHPAALVVTESHTDPQLTRSLLRHNISYAFTACEGACHAGLEARGSQALEYVVRWRKAHLKSMGS